MLSFLDGKKTYILAALGGIVVALRLLELIPSDLADALLAFLGFGGIASLRAGVSGVTLRKR